MFGLGMMELVVIAIVALLFVGPDKLPDAAKKISRGIRDFRKQTRELSKTIDEDTELGSAVRDLKSALRGDDFSRPPVRKPPPKPEEPAGETSPTGEEPPPETEPAPDYDDDGVPIVKIAAGAVPKGAPEGMRRGEQMYVYGETVSEASLDALSRLLDFAARNDISVIGFLPSYTPQLWERMIARGNHSYIEALTPRLRELFAAHDFPFFDFSDGASTGSSDDEFFDGWHASELSNLRLYLAMLEALPEILGEYSDVEMLTRIAASATNTWDVFGMTNTPNGS